MDYWLLSTSEHPPPFFCVNIRGCVAHTALSRSKDERDHADFVFDYLIAVGIPYIH